MVECLWMTWSGLSAQSACLSVQGIKCTFQPVDVMIGWPTWGPEDEAPWYGGIAENGCLKVKECLFQRTSRFGAARLFVILIELFKDGKLKNAYLNEAIKIYVWEELPV